MNNYLKRCEIFLAVALLAFVPTAVLAATTTPAGIARDAVWFSKDPFVAGERITIYTAVFNSSAERFEGTAEFYDNGITIGKKTFVVAPSGGLESVGLPWEVTAGQHTFHVKIVDGHFAGGGGTAFPTSLARSEGVARVALLPPPPPPSVVATTAATTSASVNPALRLVEDRAPAVVHAVASSALPVIGAVDAWRITEASETKDDIRHTVTALAATSSTMSTTSPEVSPVRAGWSIFAGQGIGGGEAFKSPLQYCKLFLLLVWSFILDHPIIFGILFVLLAIKLMRFVFGLLF